MLDAVIAAGLLTALQGAAPSPTPANATELAQGACMASLARLAPSPTPLAAVFAGLGSSAPKGEYESKASMRLACRPPGPPSTPGRNWASTA